MPYFCEADYRHDPALFTLECSRPAIGPYTVMASLNGIGLQGYQMLVANAIDMARILKERIERLEFCKVLNLDTPGPAVVWWVLPHGRNAKEIFQRIENGALRAEDCQRYFSEIQRLFEKARGDAGSCSRTRGSPSPRRMGYKPHGIPLAGLESRVLQSQDRSGRDRPADQQHRRTDVKNRVSLALLPCVKKWSTSLCRPRMRRSATD